MKVLIAGAGAIGCWLGLRLHNAGHEVTLLGRQNLVDAPEIRVSGLTKLSAKLPVITEPTGSYDAVFLTCKAHQTASLGAAVAPLGDAIISLQNGLGNGEKLHQLAPGKVAISLTSHGIKVDAPGQLVHAGSGVTKVGPVHDQPAGPAVEIATQLLADAGLDPQQFTAMRGHIWQKAIVNAGINPVAAMRNCPNGDLLGESWPLVESLVREATSLAIRARVELPPGDVVEITRSVCAQTAANRCSMLQDMDAKRPTEIEQITGRMVRLAELLLVSIPRSESVYGRIKDMETEYLGAEASEETAWAELKHIALTI